MQRREVSLPRTHDQEMVHTQMLLEPARSFQRNIPIPRSQVRIFSTNSSYSEFPNTCCEMIFWNKTVQFSAVQCVTNCQHESSSLIHKQRSLKTRVFFNGYEILKHKMQGKQPLNMHSLKTQVWVWKATTIDIWFLIIWQIFMNDISCSGQSHIAVSILSLAALSKSNGQPPLGKMRYVSACIGIFLPSGVGMVHNVLDVAKERSYNMRGNA